MEDEIKKIKEKIKPELTADLYEEVSGVLNRINNIYMQTNGFCESETKRKDYYAEMYNKEVKEKVKAQKEEEKWQKYYKEVCQQQAKLEIELDIAKVKIELLKKPEQN